MASTVLASKGKEVAGPNGGSRRWAGQWWRLVALFGAVLGMVIASCSPIDYYAATLFWVHMIQHLILISVVAPLIVVAAPYIPLKAAAGLRFDASDQATARASRLSILMRHMLHPPASRTGRP